MITKNMGVKGSYKIRVVNEDGSVDSEHSFDNILTNYFFTASITGHYLQVGSGVVPATVTDTALGSPVGPKITKTSVALSSIDAGAGIWTLQGEYKFVFNTGAVVGAISELGLFNASSGLTMFSRSLLKNIVGDPIVLNVTALQQLQVFWYLQVNVDANPTFYPAVNVDGVPTDITLRVNNLNANLTANYFTNSLITSPQFFFKTFRYKCSVGTVALDPGMSTPGGDLTGSVTASGFAGTPTSSFATVDNNNCRGIITAAGLTTDDITAGSNFIFNMSANSASANSSNFSLQFSPNIVKTNLQTLNFKVIIQYVRI
jgi:hypothetical protein